MHGAAVMDAAVLPHQGEPRHRHGRHLRKAPRQLWRHNRRQLAEREGRLPMATQDARHLEGDPASERVGQGPLHTHRGLGHRNRTHTAILQAASGEACRGQTVR
eukprot:13363675-Heterocapsa_arctica.AAC.1